MPEEQKKMKICPLLFKSQSTIGQANCRKDECAWWVSNKIPNFQGCAIEAIANSIKTISINLPS